MIPNAANIGSICRVRITPLMPIGGDEMLQETFPVMALGAGTSCPTPNLYWQIFGLRQLTPLIIESETEGINEGAGMSCARIRW